MGADGEGGAGVDDRRIQGWGWRSTQKAGSAQAGRQRPLM